MDQRPDRVLSRQRKASGRPVHRPEPLSAGCRGSGSLSDDGRGRSRVGARRIGLRAPLPLGARARRGAFRSTPRRRAGARVGSGGTGQPACASNWNRMSAAVGVDLLRATLEAREEPGVAELLEALRTVARDAGVDEWTSELTPLKRRVYRLHLNESHGARSVILKRSEPQIAQLNRLVAERWLPALRLGDHCAALLATAADRQGRWVWQVYEDVGLDTLERQSDQIRVGATTDFIAELHGRGSGHALLPEVRHHGKDLGLAFFAANVGDAIRGLERLSGKAAPEELRSVGDRLLRRI